MVNADGQLVGICSHGVIGPELVSVANVGAMLPPAKPAGPRRGWACMSLPTTRVPLSSTGSDPDGPAAAVGIVVGDVITAVDGVAVANVDELKAAIAAHAPDDVVTLTITHADQTSADVAVTLGTAPSM